MVLESPIPKISMPASPCRCPGWSPRSPIGSRPDARDVAHRSTTSSDVPCELMGDVRTEHFTRLTKEDWERAQPGVASA